MLSLTLKTEVSTQFELSVHSLAHAGIEYSMKSQNKTKCNIAIYLVSILLNLSLSKNPILLSYDELRIQP